MTSRQKRALRAAGLPTPEPPKPPEPERSPLCADSADSGGCYHFRDGPEREECRAGCRMLRRDEEPRTRRAAGGLGMALLLSLVAAGGSDVP